jgi:outer membrane protein OmpA-like peptidoglycan-associated protein
MISWISVSLVLTGCATTGDGLSSSDTYEKNSGKFLGTLIGGVGGALLGKKIGNKNGAVIGALVGGGIGYLIGDEIDQRREALQKIAQAQNAQIAFEDIKDNQGETVGQSVVLHSEKSQFDSAKDALNEYAKPMFVNIAKQYASSGQKVLIVGHTDADGSDQYNQALSERRAKTIATLFKDNGVKEENIYYRGAGEFEPIASNQNEKGKALNRRVEIIEAPDEATMSHYALNKPINSGLYMQEKTTRISSSDGKKIASKSNNQNRSLTQNGSSNNFGINPTLPNTTAANGFKGDGRVNGTSGLSGLHVAIPQGFNGGSAKFPSVDLGGLPKITGVSGPYYVSSTESTKDPVGSCNNEYYFTKQTQLELQKGEIKKPEQNQLIAMIGRPKEAGTFSFVTQAHADNTMLSYYGSCLQDSVKAQGEIKKLSTGEAILVKENYNLAPVLNGSTWGALVDGEFIMFSPVGVLRSNMQSVSCPELNLIKKGSNQPWYGTTTKTITYNGEDGLLYRIYPQDTSKIQCMDIAYPHGNPQNAQGIIYYKDKQGKIAYQKAQFFSLTKEGDRL